MPEQQETTFCTINTRFNPDDGALTVSVKCQLIEDYFKKLATKANGDIQYGTPFIRGGETLLTPYGGDKLKRTLARVQDSFATGWGLWDTYGNEYIGSLLLAKGLGEGISFTFLPTTTRLWSIEEITRLRKKLSKCAMSIWRLCMNEYTTTDEIVFVRSTAPLADEVVETATEDEG